ncbi:MAG: metal ABC transporter substrate-binding protein [Syntrophomonadaceae bacterium]
MRFKSNKRKSYFFTGMILSTLLLVFLAPMFIGGCSNNKATNNTLQQEPTIIVTSFYPMYIMTKNIAGNIPDVQIINMTKPTTGCLHDYQLTTEDLKNLEKAKFFVVNGAGMESFMDKVTTQRPDLKVITASNGIALLKDEDGEENPHVWVSVSLAIRQVQSISEQLAAADPAHAQAYQTNATVYVKKLEDLKSRMHQGLDGLKQKDIITFHEAFPYFAQEFNLNIAAIIEREPGSEPSAGELAETIALIRKTGIKAVFAEPQYSDKAAQAIANETGVQLSYLDPAVSGPDDPNAYISVMEQNLAILEKILGGK